MSAVDDYLHCPPLSKWLPARLEGRTVHHVRPQGWLAAPRTLLRIARRWPELEATATEVDAGPEVATQTGDGAAVVLVGSLRRSAAVGVLQRLPPGTLVVELAALGGLRVGERLFGIAARRSTRSATLRRLDAWLRAGLADVEQWMATDPPDTCVTVGYRRQ